jgi:hypothetical protein
MNPKKRIGEMLLEAGIIDETQLKAALGHQRQWGMRLGQALVDLKLATETDIVRALSLKFGFEVAKLDALEPYGHEQALKLFPREFVVRNNVFPMWADTANVTVAMSDPTNLAIVDEIRFRTGRRVKVCIGGDLEVAEAVKRGYPTDEGVEAIALDLDADGGAGIAGEAVFDPFGGGSKDALEAFFGGDGEAEREGASPAPDAAPSPARAPSPAPAAVAPAVVAPAAGPARSAPPQPHPAAAARAPARTSSGLPAQPGTAWAAAPAGPARPPAAVAAARPSSAPAPARNAPAAAAPPRPSAPGPVAARPAAPPPARPAPAPAQPAARAAPAPARVAQRPPLELEERPAPPRPAAPAPPPQRETAPPREAPRSEPVLASELASAEAGEGPDSRELTERELAILESLDRLADGAPAEPDVVKPTQAIAALIRLLIRKRIVSEQDFLDELSKK